MFVKICGITRAEDLGAVVEAGADAAGFVAWPKSKRYIPPERVAELLRGRAPLLTAAVFVDPSVEDVERYLEAGVTVLQFHGSESPVFLTGFQGGAEIWKAAGLSSPEDIERLAAFEGSAAKLLVDAFDPVRKGGTGRLCDTALASAAVSSLKKPVILAGGLNLSNLESVVTKVKPYGVDVSGGVETAPGVKDAELIRKFVRLAKSL
jgi:phosphoribosylanthranilate isomerase